MGVLSFLNSLDQELNTFLFGVSISFILLLILLILLRLTIPYVSKLFGNKPIPYKSTTESNEWLNFVLYRILCHFRKRESIDLINEIVNAKIKPHHFNLYTLGSTPIVNNVLTLEMKEVEDIKIIIPIEWIDGPFLQIIVDKNLACIEFYLKKFAGQILVSWPENSPSQMQFRFIGDLNLEFDLSIQIKNLFYFSLLEIPLLGPVIKGIIELIITRQVFELIFPLPNLDPNLSA